MVEFLISFSSLPYDITALNLQLFMIGRNVFWQAPVELLDLPVPLEIEEKYFQLLVLSIVEVYVIFSH